MLVCLSVWPGAGCEPFFVNSATLSASEQVMYGWIMHHMTNVNAVGSVNK